MLASDAGPHQFAVCGSGSSELLFLVFQEGKHLRCRSSCSGSATIRFFFSSRGMENGRKMKAKMKSKTNKKCVRQNGDEPEGKESEEGIEKPNVKKSKRGSVIMEGSRCSRVNGRRWRCCQQTIVGYSLCEHHLGKGRLRSMVSVRNQAMASNPSVLQKDESEKANQMEKRLVADNDEDDDNGDDDDEEKPLMVRKKRMKLRMVKARSVSSLLSQTDNAVVVADNSKRSS
ncbi:unnamed protein product [Ilex paraguariensis]|uniref:WRC domain-containing protein n=1 Tax=Ilex paraguariensis TaxID=185542 RepID=A0ABC8RUP5_9AQUA